MNWPWPQPFAINMKPGKKILLLILNLIALAALGQDKPNIFHIIDSETSKAVPLVSISILRAGLSITTEKDGVFIIPGNMLSMRDTIVFQAQNYVPVKMPLSMLALSSNIPISKYKFDVAGTALKYKNDTVINVIEKLEVNHYAGVDTETSYFNYLQLAQQFEAPVAGCRLNRIRVYRMAFNDPPGYTSQRAAYRLRFYDVDPVTGGPGCDLTNDVVEITDDERRQDGSALSKYNIIIPQKKFFVAVEWLRNVGNEGYSMLYDPKTKAYKQRDNYRPAIGIAPKTGKKLNVWGLNFKHQWAPYNYFMPFGTDLAITATVEYN